MESIYKMSRQIKRTEHSLYNALRSIYQDSLFVSEIHALWPHLPLLANLRCGLWYSPVFHSHCYFKSTDGHNGNWSFNLTRLNLHVALLAAVRGGCMIVDATRKGKRFPDSMSKTIPIWACVINRALADLDERPEDGSDSEWDCDLHLPVWVSETEKNNIANRLEAWVADLKSSRADLGPLARTLRKPLRALWISQRTVIWLNEVVDTEALDFTPMFVVSASQPVSQRVTDAEFSWSYIPGAADDEESWSRGLTPSLFWDHVCELVDGGPGDCNRRVAALVERERVYRAVRGHDAPQVRVKSSKKVADPGTELDDSCHLALDDRESETLQDGNPCNRYQTDVVPGLHWIGSTGLAVGGSSCCQADSRREVVDCILDVCPSASSTSSTQDDSYLHLPVVGSKFDRHSLQDCLPEAVNFAREKLATGLSILICCPDGEDISVCVCLAILLSCFDSVGNFCSDGLKPQTTSKSEVRRRLVQLASFHSGARPSRGSLKQVYNYLQHQQ